jgi:uncharacterized protein
MRLAMVWLLAIMLAACGDTDAPLPAEPSPDDVPERIERLQPPALPALDWKRLIDPTPIPRAIPQTIPASPVPGSLLLRPEVRYAPRPVSPAESPELVETPALNVEVPASRPISSVRHRGEADLPLLAIIIDDVGHGLSQGRRIIALPAPVALAILPHTLAARQLAEEARQAGRTVMLHLPMENQGGTSIGPGGLYAHMSQAEFQRVLNENLDSFQGIQGVNNHMGSLLTTLRPQMDWLMQELKMRGLFFVDSRTSAQTQAAGAAAARGLPHLSRHVFLDNLRTPDHLNRSFDEAVRRARKEGYAVMIGHPYPETLAFLERRLSGLEEREGVRVVPVETLLDGQSRSD